MKRDRLNITLDGTVRFVEPVLGKVTGAVFEGQGRLETKPWSEFELGNVQRMLKSDVVDVDFKRAVLRFTDDTYDRLVADGGSTSGASISFPGGTSAEMEERVAAETGLNLSSRLLLSLVNKEDPGFFFAEFDGGGRGRFGAVLDSQCRSIGGAFDIDGGEKGLVYQFRDHDLDVWTAFYDEGDMQSGLVEYPDVFDIVQIDRYDMDVDLTKPGSWLRLAATLEMTALQDGVRLIPLNLNDSLTEYEDTRRKKGMHLVSARTEDGAELEVIHHEWEKGVTVALPAALAKGAKAKVRLEFEGKDTLTTTQSRFHYTLSTTSWYPRHGYLARSEFELRFRHPKKSLVVSVGERVAEGPDPEDAEVMETRWQIKEPVALVTFALGDFERHLEETELKRGKTPIEFYSMPGGYRAIKEDFILAELGNGLRYFEEQFSDYPYKRLGAVFFPRGYGQGFPSLLLLPSTGRADKYQFAFISHEGAHQWWGNIVGWRTYRDQWMSEGFAEYSGMLYTWLRQDKNRMLDLVREGRNDLIQPPRTDTGILDGTVAEIGPLILGRRLNSRRTQGAYSTLIYQKGALVLRMLHLLFTDPESGNADAFFAMMRDFVESHRNGLATTESFLEVASKHFVNTPIAKKYQMPDIRWFFSQWVYQSALPSYRLEYSLEKQGSGVMLKGTVFQEDAPDGWFMPLPLVFDFGGDNIGRTVVAAFGPQRDFALNLPAAPKKVELDPDMWVLSKNTSTKQVKR